MKAVWHGRTLAESDDIVMVENNAYFPETALDRSLFKPSEHVSVCPWKGTAKYYTVSVDGTENENAAWTYPEPKPGAEQISGRVAFWKGVTVS